MHVVLFNEAIMQTTVTCAEIEKRLLIALRSRGSRNQANAFSYIEPPDESHFPWLIANVYAGAHETLRASLSFKRKKRMSCTTSFCHLRE